MPWELLETATAPDGGELRLLRRGNEFSIRLADGNELMNSRLGGSEEALAILVMDRLAQRSAPRILIGGLGMGFTFRAALARGSADLRVVVAEIVPELIGWARGPMADVFGDSLSDPRLEVVARDVGACMCDARGAFDAILLDVDNGPNGLTRPGNAALYGEEGLRAARRALAREGVLAIWSASPDRAFVGRLSESGFETSTHTARATRSGRGARHTIWLAVATHD